MPCNSGKNDYKKGGKVKKTPTKMKSGGKVKVRGCGAATKGTYARGRMG